MNFDFTPIHDTAILLGKPATICFAKARRQGSNSLSAHIHREWIRDIAKLFAAKAEVTFAQGWQLIVTGNFSKAKKMHYKHMLANPEIITVIDEGQSRKVENFVWARYRALANMQDVDHHAFVREAFSWALTLRHPDNKVSARKPNTEISPSLMKADLKHPDELRSSHKRRALEALAAELNKVMNMSDDQVMDRLMRRVDHAIAAG